jgi:hypothetical protein
MAPKAHPRNTAQVLAEQKATSERDRLAAQRRAAPQKPDDILDQFGKSNGKPRQAIVPAPKGDVAVPDDNRSDVQRYLDEVAPASIVGRLIKFSKEGKFVTPDDDEPIADGVDCVVLADQTLVGWVKFNGEGQPPDRRMGLLFDNFVMPDRKTLGNDDVAKWEMGLDGRPQDPWQHHQYLVLQRSNTGELFTYASSSLTGRRAIGNLLRHYTRLQKTHPDMLPVVRLRVGGFNHRDERVGWVNTPVLAVVGRAPKDSAAVPDTSTRGDLDDAIPF